MENKDIFTAAGGELEHKGVPGYVPAPLVLGDERRVPGDQREQEEGESQDGKPAEDEKDQKDGEPKGTASARKTASGSK